VGAGRDPRRGAGPALSRAQRLADAVRRWLRPPRTLRPTRAGWIFFALTFGVGFGALNTGNNLLYLVLSLMLAFLVLSGILSESALRGIHVARRLPAELFAEQSARVHLEITNDQRRVPAFAVAVEDECSGPPRPGPGGGGAAHVGRVFVLCVGPDSTEHRGYALSPAGRGTLRFRTFRVSTRFPFGLFVKSKTLEAPAEALVYPAVDALAARPVAGPRDGDGAAAARTAVGALAGGVRDFARGDSLRRVHWRRSLRRGQLVVREVEDDRAAESEVRLATRGVDPERFELLVRRAASEVVAQLAAGLRVGLRTDEERLPPAAGRRQRARLLAHLARVQADPVSPA
jgi:uncharacterized protein (DUF58 family)